MASIVTELMTLFMPGAGPPPTRIPSLSEVTILQPPSSQRFYRTGIKAIAVPKNCGMGLPLSAYGTPIRPTLRTFIWAKFDLTKAIMPSAIT